MENDAYITMEDIMREIAELLTFPVEYVPLKLKYIRAMIIDWKLNSIELGG